MSDSGNIETTEFRRSFHQETNQLLRRRLIWFIAIWGGLGALFFGLTVMMMMFGDSSLTGFVLNGKVKAFYLISQGVWVTGYIGVLMMVLEKRVSVQRVIHLSMALIILDGLVAVAIRSFEPSLQYGLWVFVISHFVACCVFPWTVRQAVVPMVVVVGVSSVCHLLMGVSVGGMVFFGVSTVAFNTPALFVCGFKHSQRIQKSTNRFLNHRYGMLRQELAYARQIHEALFPVPKTTGQIHFVYRYEPMRQIGGDYLFARHTQADDEGNEILSVVMIDVTGHGIPAALTVNRLHGEIDLRFAEQPDVSPGELLSHLNRYIHLTLSKHSIFATAACFRVIGSRNILEYASGGHPPAFLRGVDGTLVDLEATTFMLGACPESAFDPLQTEVEFGPGDTLIAYTDGATEARGPDGKMLNIDGLRRIVASVHPLGTEGEHQMQGQWSEKILREVSMHLGGAAADDDTLAFEIYRPIRVTSCTMPDEDALGK